MSQAKSPDDGEPHRLPLLATPFRARPPQDLSFKAQVQHMEVTCEPGKNELSPVNLDASAK